MNDPFNPLGDYRIEISGWGPDNNFFVERTDLQWTADGDQSVLLHRSLPEGDIVFLRLLSSNRSSGSLPVACEVRSVLPMDCNGCCQMTLRQLHQQSRESITGHLASNNSERSEQERETTRGKSELQREEIHR